MNIELLTIPGCPHSHSARELFTIALELEGIDPALLTVKEITTDADAVTVSFHGSPSFTIDGADLFPSTAAPALTCRVYPSQQGFRGQPDLESLRTAIRGHRPRGRPRTRAGGAHPVEPTKNEITAGYRRAIHDLDAWIGSTTPADLHRKSTGTRWTNEELLFHMVFGYMVVRALLPLVRVVSRLPKPAGVALATMLNAGTRPFDVVNYWGSRAAALVYNRRRMGRKLERTINALARRLAHESSASLARSMPFPDRWDPFFKPVMTLHDVYAYPTLHFDFHAKQLNLRHPEGRGRP